MNTIYGSACSEDGEQNYVYWTRGNIMNFKCENCLFYFNNPEKTRMLGI